MIGIHPNTLRLYEATGYIAPVGREANGYRSFAPYHIVQARIARLSGKLTWMSGPIRNLTLANIRLCRDFACERALATLGELDRTLASEQKLAEEAVRAVERFRRRPGRAVEDAVPRRLLRVGRRPVSSAFRQTGSGTGRGTGSSSSPGKSLPVTAS
jgi:DNA-binding transcriptional MerR regulator